MNCLRLLPLPPGYAKPLRQRLLALLVALLVFATAGGGVGTLSMAQQKPTQKQSAKPTAVPVESTSGEAPVQSGGAMTQTITMADLGNKDGYTLETIKTERRYGFTRPKNWKTTAATAIHLSFQHSPALLPERSSLNILVNNRILKTISLGDSNVTATQEVIPIPAGILKDRNEVAFQVDQHYTYECEDPFSKELWTTILPETKIRLVYDPQPIEPNLAHFPFPLFDPLSYGPTQIGFIAPSTLADPSLEGVAVTATALGQAIGWREAMPFMAEGLSSYNHLVVVGTPEENPAIGQLRGNLPLTVSGNGISDGAGKALPADTGVLMAVPNPNHPDKTVLIVTGTSPAGVKKAAHALAQKPTNQLLVGRYAIIETIEPGPVQPYRAWHGFLYKTGKAFFNELGFETLSSRGITALPIFYKVRKMPDIWMEADDKVKLRTVYSYSSQLDPEQSKLEVLWNGKPLKSVPLNDADGKNQAVLELEIPAPEFYTYNDLEYRFHVFPDKFGLCKFVTDVHIWGTIHNSSSIELPGRIKSPLPDVGLLNDGVFPFSIYQDFSDVAVVLPDKPNQSDVDTMIQMLVRFGRESKTQTGIHISAHRAGQVPGDVKGKAHLIVIGDKSRNPLFTELSSKLKLLIEKPSQQLEENLAKLRYTPEQGVIEEILSPWNDGRVVMLVYGETAEAATKIRHLFTSDKWFSQIMPGNLLVVNGDGPKSLTFLNRGEAKFIYPADFMPGPKIPNWVWVIIGLFTFIGILAVLKLFFGGGRR